MLTIRRAREDDKGVTLIETLVVMVLSALLMTIAATFFVTVTKQTMASENIRASTADASNIVNVVSTSIRASIRNAKASSPNPDPAIVEGSATAVTIISYTDAGPSFELPVRLRYSVDAQGRMVEQRWLASEVGGYAVFPAMSVTPDAVRVLGNVVVNTSVEPLFRYYDVTGAPLGAVTALNATERDAVTSVRFRVKVRAENSDQVVDLDNTIGMPNMNLGVLEED